MKRLATLGLMLSFAFVALGAQAPPRPAPSARPSPTPAPPPVLEGTVKGPDAKPLEKALVLARPTVSTWGEPARHARTDASGRFRIELKSARPHEVRVEAAGLASKRLERVQPGAPLTIVLGKGVAIEGTVRDSQGAPVPKARVTARDEGGITAPELLDADLGLVQGATDAKGVFRLEGLAAGLHTLTARARGLGYGRRSNVRAGTRADIVLLPGSTLFGRITNLRGQPVAGALVSAEREERGMGPNEAPLETTDAAGQYEVGGLAPGTYSLTVRHQEHAPTVALGLNVEVDAETSANLVLGGGAKISGRLVDGAGRPLKGRITLQEVDGRSAPRILAGLLRGDAGPDGRFELPAVGPGAYVLAAAAPAYAPQRVEAAVPAQGARPVEVGDVVLERGLTISGRVRDKAGARVGGASIRAFPNSPLGPSSPAEAETGEDGSFVLAGLAEGAYRITARSRGYAEATETATSGSEGVELVLTAGGAITGVVTDDVGQPLETAAASAEPASRSRMFVGRSGFDRADADGRFTIEDLAEGAYVVRAEAPEMATGTVSDVKVVPGQTTDAGRIRLPRGGVIRGTVVDSAGAAVAGASISTMTAEGFAGATPMTRASITSGAGGVFEAKGVPAGEVEVIATHPRYTSGSATVQVEPTRGAAEARIVLSQGGRVEGWARKRDGTPLAGRIQVTPHSGPRFASSPSAVSLKPDGSFAVEHVPPGTMRVTLMQGTPLRYVSTVMREVEVKEGETTTVELSSRDILISGHVTRQGIPLPRVRVLVRRRTSYTSSMSFGMGPQVPGPSSGPERTTGITREDGSYELLLDDAGEASLSVETLDGKTTLVSRTTTVPDADAHVIDVALAGVGVTGVVIDRGTEKPVGEARVSAYRRGRSRDGTTFNARTDPQGRFTMEVDPGEYRIYAAADAYNDATVEMTIGETGASDVRIGLEKGASIEGRVVDTQGRPAAGARLSATPVETRSRPPGMVTVLSDGSFRIDGLERKPYTLLAGSSRGFALHPGVSAGAKDLVLTLQPGGKARVEVVSPEGAPVLGAFVSLAEASGSRVMNPVFGSNTDAQGVVVVDVPAGPVVLYAGKERLYARATATVPAGGTVAVRIQLTARPGSPRE